ncbi:MAG: universal stress protein [Chloroflexota bacterium]
MSAGCQRALILVGVDGSPPACQALAVAAGLARLVGGSVAAVHVVVAPEPASFDAPWTALRAHDAAHSTGEEILAEAHSLVGDVLVACELHPGRPADTLCRRAAELGADLVVVGSRGLGRLDRLLLGSVSAAVAAQAPCSVLVVRPRRERRRERVAA